MKYWAYINDEIKGPLEKEEIIKLEGFNASTLICPQSPLEEETKEWKEASSFPEFAIAATPAHNIDETSKAEEEINSGKLNVSDKKEDIMIERFSMENIFTTPIDSNNINLNIPNTDPLTLSQIRNRGNDVSQDLSSEEEIKNRTSSDPMTLSQIKNRGESMIEKMESDNAEKNTLSEDSPLNQPNDVDLKIDDDSDKKLEEIEDFEIPDTDSLIASDISAITPEQPAEMPREEPEEFNIKPLEAKNITEEDLKIENREINQDSDVNMLPVDDLKSTDINETIMSSEPVNINNNSSNISEIDINKIKEEILSEVKTLIDEINSETVKREELEKLKMEIDEKISVISTNPAQSQDNAKESLNHLEIEVNDLSAKLDMIQKRLDESPKSNTTSKPDEEVIEQNLKPANIERLSKVDKKEATKTVVMPLDEKEENKKLSELPKKILKSVIILILIIVATAAILFFLKQIGIFDTTKLLSKKDNNIQFQTNPQLDKTDNSTNVFPPDISTMTTVSTPTASVDFNLMSSTVAQQPPMNPGAQINSVKNPLTSDNAILNEVKNYKMETNENLEQVIKRIVREKKANVTAINWGIVPDKDNTYLITATVKNKKNILFKFNYEPNSKILKPLNTLSINTINILMGKANQQQQSKKVQPKANIHQTRPKALQEPIKNEMQETMEEQQIDNINDENETSEDEYLIIGE